MGILVPEHASRKIDTLGRITLPKGLRDRMEWGDNDDIELFTANLEGRMCVVMSKPVTEEMRINEVIDFLAGFGYAVKKVED